MRKLFYMGLEPYEGRYTLQLQQWNEAVFKRWIFNDGKFANFIGLN